MIHCAIASLCNDSGATCTTLELCGPRLSLLNVRKCIELIVEFTEQHRLQRHTHCISNALQLTFGLVGNHNCIQEIIVLLALEHHFQHLGQCIVVGLVRCCQGCKALLWFQVQVDNNLRQWDFFSCNP